MGIRCRHMLRGYVGDIRCGHTLVTYVGGMRWSHRIPQVYVGYIGRGCTAVRVMSVGVPGVTGCGLTCVDMRVGWWCQEHKSVPMTDIVLSLLHLVVMYVYIIA